VIDRDHDLTITRQAELLNVSCGSVLPPRPVNAADLELMRRLAKNAGGCGQQKRTHPVGSAGQGRELRCPVRPAQAAGLVASSSMND